MEIIGRGFIATNLRNVDPHAPGVIVMLDAVTGIPDCYRNPHLAVQKNLAMLNDVLCMARDNEKRVIFASSVAATQPDTIYGATKAGGEALCRAHEREYGTRVTVLRFSNVYGPYSWHKKSVVATMCRAALDGEPIRLQGATSRDFIHVDDVCEAIVQAATNYAGGTYTVCTGKLTPVKQVATTIAEMTGAKIERAPARTHEEPPPVQTPHLPGWRHLISLEVGLAQTVNWFKEQYA